ncbi:MAG: TIGR01777 family oxidoreductase [Vicingaceae bacterium]
MKILITGTGTVAKCLANQLLKNNHEVIFLSTSKKQYPYYYWNPSKKIIDKASLKDVDVIFHLAGAGIADKRWTNKRKKEIIDSRVKSAKLILNALLEEQQSIKQFISASAIGYYGTVTSDKIFKEEDLPGNDFLSVTCQQWENIAWEFKKHGIAQQVSIHRLGIVFAENSGALPKMLYPFKFKTGVILGSGKQWLPWIDINDAVYQLVFAMDNRLEGVFNCVTDVNNQITYKSFIQQQSVKFKPFFIIRIPAFILKLILGEMATILLEGSRVSNEKIKKLRF